MPQHIIVPSGSEIVDEAPFVFSGWHEVPAGYESKSKWDRQYCRKIKSGETPKAVVRWTVQFSTKGETHHPDGTITYYERPCERVRECSLYTVEQTRPYRPTNRTLAIRWFQDVFQKCSSKEYHIKQSNAGWKSIRGKLPLDDVERHLRQEDIFGVRASKYTRHVGFDHDFHGGDEAVFLCQLDLLLSYLWGNQAGQWGTGPWFAQVSENDANGVHLFSVLPSTVETEWLHARIREFLRELDNHRPDLVQRARDAGMRPLGDMEILPTREYGLRLPFSKGRTLLLDQPLKHALYRQRQVVDVVRLKEWVEDENRQYMPQAQVIGYVASRLKSANSGAVRRKFKAPKKATIPRSSDGEIRMKGNYRRFLVAFWSGQNNPPDSLNLGIRQLSLMAPYYFSDAPEAAICRIEAMIDELPDPSFSTRISSGRRDQVSKVVRANIAAAYQPGNPRSKMKLDQTYSAWNRRGFNPFDKVTWKSRATGPLWDWSQDEMTEVSAFASLLKTDAEAAAKFLRRLIHHIATSERETSIPYVNEVMKSQNIRIGSKRDNKAKRVLDRLMGNGWIRLQMPHAPGKKARKFELGANLASKYNRSPHQHEQKEEHSNNNKYKATASP